VGKKIINSFILCYITLYFAEEVLRAKDNHKINTPGGGSEFFSSPPRPDCAGAHPASYPTGTRGPFPGGKAAGAWSYTSTPKYASLAWYSVKAQRQFYFYQKVQEARNGPSPPPSPPPCFRLNLAMRSTWRTSCMEKIHQNSRIKTWSSRNEHKLEGCK
jgi:hypothetical protein